jgi:hypothetical protein
MILKLEFIILLVVDEQSIPRSLQGSFQPNSINPSSVFIERYL